MKKQLKQASIRVSVEYKQGLSLHEVVEEISLLSSPHILLWYIGIYGLKKNGATFYKDFLISPILEQQPSATFWLVDLTAWGALRNPRVSISKASHFSEKIRKFNNPHIKCIKSADILKKIQNIRDPDSVSYFRDAIRKEFIRKPSENTPDRNIKVHTLFENNCPVISEWYDSDTSKCYSTLQYLEGCLLIDEIIQQIHNSTGNIEIVFALPNDEIKYYWDETNAFQKDVEFLVNHHYMDLIGERKILVKFLCFQYGKVEHHRPYNAPGKVFKRNELSCDHIIDKAMEKPDGGKI